MNYYRQDYSLFKVNGIWYFWYYDGKRKKKTTGSKTKAIAKDRAERFVKSLKRSRKGFESFAKGFFDKDSLYMKGPGRSLSFASGENLRANLENHVMPYFKDHVLHEITARDIETFLSSMDKSSQTQKHTLNTIRIILREAEKDRLIPSNPADLVRVVVRGERYDAFTIKELKKFLSVIEEPKYHLMFSLMAATGLRSGEVRALRMEDVLFDRNAIMVTRSADRYGNIVEVKGGESRVVYCPSNVMETLRHHPFVDLLFPGRGGIISSHIISTTFKKYLVKSEIKGKTLVPHSLRHTYNTLCDPHIPPDVIRQMTGHKSEKMRQHYTHVELLEKYDKVNRYFDSLDNLFSFL